jgi:hypothetical protein
MEEVWGLRLLGAVRLCDVIAGLQSACRALKGDTVRGKDICPLDSRPHVER